MKKGIGSIKFADAAETWLSEVSGHIKEGSYIRYETLIRKYALPEFAEADLSEMDEVRLSEFSERLNKKVSRRTASYVMTVIRRIRNHGTGISDAGRTVRIGEDNSLKDIRLLSDREANRLCAYLYSSEDPDYAGVLIVLSTGIKVGELCALGCDDIDADNAEIFIHRTLQRTQIRDAAGDDRRRTRVAMSEYDSDNTARRTLPLPITVSETLCRIPKSGGMFIPPVRGEYMEPRTMENRLKRIGDAVGIERLNFNMLRDTFAVKCLKGGTDIETLSALLGHSGVSVTEQRYGVFIRNATKDMKERKRMAISAVEWGVA